MLKQCLQYQVYLMNKYNQPQEMELANRLLNEITQELQNEWNKDIYIIRR